MQTTVNHHSDNLVNLSDIFMVTKRKICLTTVSFLFIFAVPSL